MRIVDDISELVGKTPMLRVKKLFPQTRANILAKLELSNPKIPISSVILFETNLFKLVPVALSATKPKIVVFVP